MKTIFQIFLSLMLLLFLSFGSTVGQSVQDNLYTTNGAVYAVATSGSTIYIGGSFTSVSPVGGGAVARNYIAAFDATTGAVTSWDPNADSWVMCLAVSGTRIYAGGYFDNIGGQSRGKIAALDLATGNATNWQPGANNTVFAIAISGTKVYAGGNFTFIGNNNRQNLASMDTSTTYDATSWNPSTSGTSSPVFALTVSGSTVYAGGSFTNIQGRNRIVALDATTGNAAAGWLYPTPNAAVRALAVSDTTLYVGGDFTNVDVTARNRIGALNAATGTLAAWNPNANGSVLSLAVSASAVYAGGSFTTIASTSRNNLAALDPNVNTSNVTTWDPNVNNIVRSLAICTSHAKIYAGGDFTSIMSTSHAYVAGLTNPGDASLPVELTSFTITSKQYSVELDWKTASEINNYGFEIERKSIPLGPPLQGGTRAAGEAGGFQKVGFVEGNGTTNAPREYSFTDKNLTEGKYSYRLKQIDRDGEFTYSQSVEATVNVAVIKFALDQNYPNPFNPATTISYQLPVDSRVTLKIYDVLGREVTTLVNEEQSAGWKEVQWNAKDVSSGIYFYKLQALQKDGGQAGNFVETKKLMLLK